MKHWRSVVGAVSQTNSQIGSLLLANNVRETKFLKELKQHEIKRRSLRNLTYRKDCTCLYRSFVENRGRTGRYEIEKKYKGKVELEMYKTSHLENKLKSSNKFLIF